MKSSQQRWSESEKGEELGPPARGRWLIIDVYRPVSSEEQKNQLSLSRNSEITPCHHIHSCQKAEVFYESCL